MDYNPLGRLTLVVVIVLIIVFMYAPRRQIFVYPRKRNEGKIFYMRSIVWGVALILTILRSFNIKRIDGSTIVELPQGHVLFLLDGSLSMSADDVSPNRFKQATATINHIAHAASGNAYELIVFSGLPLIRVPRTNDLQGFTEVLSGINLGNFPATDSFLGTALGDALLLGMQQFSVLPHAAKEARAIVVISDGDSNKGYDPYKVLELIDNDNIPVYFVAIGQEGYEVGKDALGLPVITSFDNDLMEEFTKRTEGKLYRNPDIPSLNELSSILSQKFSVASNKVYIPTMISLNQIIFPWMIVCYVLLLAFLCYEVFYKHARK